MNPGNISSFVKRGLEDSAKYFLEKSEYTDLNRDLIKKYLLKKNYAKLATVLGLHTVHCSEIDT